MSFWRRVTGWLMTLGGAAMIAALVHIVAILIIPLYATRDAFARLSRSRPGRIRRSCCRRPVPSSG